MQLVLPGGGKVGRHDSFAGIILIKCLTVSSQNEPSMGQQTLHLVWEIGG
jgi:hypothetical protein